jgi:class 3 adenylate cyclase
MVARPTLVPPSPYVAEADQILITQRVFAAVEEAVEADAVNDLMLKRISKPVTAFAVRALRHV